MVFLSSGYVQAGTMGNYFFSTGYYSGIFNNRSLRLLPDFWINGLGIFKLGAAWELSLGPGSTSFGLEAGYSSGSRFGGSGGIDFIPITFTAAYSFPLGNIFYVGPSLKLGGFLMTGPEWTSVTPLAGARLEVELRNSGFPLGLYLAGGLDMFIPPSISPNMLPVVEVGLRFPRGTLRRRDPLASIDDEDAVLISIVTPETDGVQAPGIQPAVETQPVVEVPQGVVQAALDITQIQQPVTEPEASGVPAPVTQPTVEVPQGVAQAAPDVAQIQQPVVEAQASGAYLAIGLQAVVPTQLSAQIPGPHPGGIIILEDGREGIFNSIYFESDTAILREGFLPILDDVGRQLAANPASRVLIRAYAAPFHTEDGRFLVSVNRARFVRDYFIRHHGIASRRITLEAFGSEKLPERATEDWETLRCAELIMFQ
jgi:outer membrane protein OmpA-like peptidoglycan-associated protein